jgi:sporulation protein YlmC with PRC-barrel domain
MKQRVMKDLRGDAIAARDGEIGKVKDVYFDDERWAVRYLVVDTGGWLTGRRVLISPASLDRVSYEERQVVANLSRKQVEEAPGLEAEQPVSRLYEEAHARYFGYPYYWTGPELWGFAPMPMLAQSRDEAVAANAEENRRIEAAERAAARSHVRSTAEVVGYKVHAVDGPAGRVDDFVVDDRDWSVESVVVDAREWLPGGQVLVPRGAVTAIDWSARELNVALTREQIRSHPLAPT